MARFYYKIIIILNNFKCSYTEERRVKHTQYKGIKKMKKRDVCQKKKSTILDH